MNGHSTHSPKGVICEKCGIEIPTGIGRRYRMKWMHEGCLPLTRLAKIDSYRDENAKLASSELREKRIKEEQEQWLKEHSEISLSGLLQKALEQQMKQNGTV